MFFLCVNGVLEVDYFKYRYGITGTIPHNAIIRYTPDQKLIFEKRITRKNERKQSTYLLKKTIIKKIYFPYYEIELVGIWIFDRESSVNRRSTPFRLHEAHQVLRARSSCC